MTSGDIHNVERTHSARGPRYVITASQEGGPHGRNEAPCIVQCRNMIRIVEFHGPESTTSDRAFAAAACVTWAPDSLMVPFVSALRLFRNRNRDRGDRRRLVRGDALQDCHDGRER